MACPFAPAAVAVAVCDASLVVAADRGPRAA